MVSVDSDQRQGIGHVVRTLRESQGMTRQQLADATSHAPLGRPVSAEMIAKIEQGRKGPSVASLTSLAHALSIEVADLSERSNAWQAAADAGVTASVLRAGTIAGGLRVSPIAARLFPFAASAAVGLAATSVNRTQQRRQLERALRTRLGDLSDEDLARVAAALGVDPTTDDQSA